MKKTFKLLTLITVVLYFSIISAGAVPDLDKAFVERYKKAFEEKDGGTLEGLLYTKNADPGALEFYKMMMMAEMGGKISSIELQPLSKEETEEASEILPSPGGGKSKLPVTPTKKLIIRMNSVDVNGTSSSTSTSFVAEINGKLLIPVPIPVKD